MTNEEQSLQFLLLLLIIVCCGLFVLVVHLSFELKHLWDEIRSIKNDLFHAQSDSISKACAVTEARAKALLEINR
jgi:hypothetical protein